MHALVLFLSLASLVFSHASSLSANTFTHPSKNVRGLHIADNCKASSLDGLADGTLDGEGRR